MCLRTSPETHHECIIHLDDVTAVQRGLEFRDPDAPPLPHVTHAGDDGVPSNRGQLLAPLLSGKTADVRAQFNHDGSTLRFRRTDLGAAVGGVGVFADDGGLRDNNARAGVLKASMNLDVLALTVPRPVNLSPDGHLSVRYEHAGNLLLREGSSRALQQKQRPGFARSSSLVDV